ncbi:MAG: efflux RND transporter periplasmic adaptor subunit [bacterium]
MPDSPSQDSTRSHARLPFYAIAFRSIVCLALLAVGGGAIAALVASKPEAARNPQAAAPQRVSVLEVRPLEIERFVRGYGTARALDSADVPARVGAVVESISPKFAPGSRVAKGDTLITLDRSDFLEQVTMAEQAIRALDSQAALLDAQERAALASAELARADRDLAATDLARVEKAAADGAAQPREVDRARQALIAASRAAVIAEDAVAQIAPRRASLAAERASNQSTLELARLSADRCTVVAPIDGVVQTADLEVGESVAPGQKIARIVNLEKVEVPLRIPASSRALAPVGAKAAVTARADGRVFAGTVARVAPEDDPNSRTATVFIEIAQSADRTDVLAPGAFVEAKLLTGGSAPRIAVPRRAIRDESIAVVESGRVRMRRISIDFPFAGTPDGAELADVDWAVLADELAPGTLVVIDGSRSLVEGQVIEPIPVHADAAKAPRAADPVADGKGAG